MKIKSLKIGNLEARLPIVQGGMGVGISLSNLAAAVANAGGVGVISGVQIGFQEDDFEENPLKANIRAMKKHISLAKEKAKNGIIGVNIMVALNHYEELVKAAIESKVDLIISGAGMPISLPKLTKGSSTKIAPIVSSKKAANLILKMWDRRYKSTADMVVVEGPKAGGHLGFKNEQLENNAIDFEKEIVDIIDVVKEYGVKYNREIPVVVAGGIYGAKDIAKYLNLGADGVQMASRFVATQECDADENFKKEYVKCNEEDIVIVKSPVGMPGRAINNNFVKKVKEEAPKITKCYNCLTPCNPKETPYCISKALINAARGDVDNALVFCGTTAAKIKEISTVPKIMKELEEELKAL